MAKPKRDRRSKSVSTPEKHQPLEVEVRFSLAKPAPPPFIVTRETAQPAKKADGPERPPLTFNL
jgi:hypothetical protein